MHIIITLSNRFRRNEPRRAKSIERTTNELVMWKMASWTQPTTTKSTRKKNYIFICVYFVSTFRSDECLLGMLHFPVQVKWKKTEGKKRDRDTEKEQATTKDDGKEHESRMESKWGALSTRSFSNHFKIPWKEPSKHLNILTNTHTQKTRIKHTTNEMWIKKTRKTKKMIVFFITCL